MRIVGEIEHPILKITIFHNENKYSVQIEDGQVSQTFKLREDSSLNSVDKLKALFSKELTKILEANAQMQAIMASIANGIVDKDELPKII